MAGGRSPLVRLREVNRVHQDTATIRRLLEQLRGTGFNVSITIDGTEFTGQKVVAFEDGLVFTVNTAGLVRATRVDRIASVDF